MQQTIAALHHGRWVLIPIQNNKSFFKIIQIFLSNLGYTLSSTQRSLHKCDELYKQESVYLGTTLTNQNSIAEEIKSRLRSGNACYHSVQNLLSSRLLTKNLKIKIYRTIILPVKFVSVLNLVADIAGGKKVEGIWEQGVEVNIWT